MKKKSVLVICILTLGVGGLGVVSFKGLGQGRPGTVQSEPLTKKQALIVPSRNASSATLPESKGPLVEAASQNATLKSGVEWLFGGKQQHGWYLYTPLIAKLIGTDKDATSPDFAFSLAGWQNKVGLVPSGILDTDTLYKMVDTWQSIRSKDHTYPAPEELVTAPPSEFLYPERPAELRQVQKTAYAAYKKMLAAAIADRSLKLKATQSGELAADEQFLKIVSSFRSHEYQEELRRKAPNAGRAGLAVNSPHFTGRALDLYVGGDPVDTGDTNRAVQVNTPVYKWLVKNAEKFGFYPYYYEPWHWEYKPQP